MTEAGLAADPLLPWLLRIYLPWMEIKYAGLSVSFIDVLHGPARHPVRQQPEVSTTTTGKIMIEQ